MNIGLEPDSNLQFSCNICGAHNSKQVSLFHREIPDCTNCSSTPRFRGIIHALSIGLFGSSRPLPLFPMRKDIKGVGMSEWEGYAHILNERFSFQNTFFHTEPKLDIMGEDWRNYTDLDFVICTEVFEHILQPVSQALDNIRHMLKPNGVLIFSAPYTDGPNTTEHFPGMRHFALCQIQGKWLVVGEHADGQYQVFDRDICFHGGPGSVLEMRLFCQSDLCREFDNAGYQVKIYDEPDLGIGYVWEAQEERVGFGRSLGYIMEARPTVPTPATPQSSE